MRRFASNGAALKGPKASAMDVPLLFPAEGSTKTKNKNSVAPDPETFMKTRTSAGVAVGLVHATTSPSLALLSS